MNPLSIGSIRRFFNLTPKVETTLSDLLQVFELQVNKKDNKEICTITLSDSVNLYSKFYFTGLSGVNRFDVIKIGSLTKTLGATNKIFFKINGFEVVNSATSLIGSPVIFDPNSISKFEETAKPKSITNKPATTGPIVPAIEAPVFTQKQPPTKTHHMQLSTLSTFTKDMQVLVRCTKKSEKKSFKSPKEGSVFNFVIMDTEGSEMQVSCFNKVANKLYPVIQEGGLYEIIGGYIKINDKKYNQTKSDYQISLNDESLVYPIIDDNSVAVECIKLTKLSELEHMKVHSSLDILVEVVSCNEQASIKSKFGELKIRRLVVVDDSEFKVDLTLWKGMSDTEAKPGDILYIRNAKIGEYSGKNISASEDSHITVNPIQNSIQPFVESLISALNSKKEEGGKSQFSAFKSYSEKQAGDYKKRDDYKLVPLLEAYNIEEKLHKVKVFVTQFNNSEKNIYGGCPKCKKKIVDTLAEDIRCPGCNEAVPKLTYYFTISVRVKDCSGDHWVDFFGLAAEKVLGVTGEEYRNALLVNDEQVLTQVCKNVEFKSFVMTLKSRTTIYNNVVKKKLNCLGVDKVDLRFEAERMLQAIELV